MHAEYLAVSSYNHVSLIVKAQTNDSDTRDDHLGFGVGRDFDYAAMTAAARGDVDIAVTIERQALGPAEPRKESRDFAAGADPHQRIETRKRRPRDVKITVRPEAEVISGHACFKCRERSSFADLVYEVDRAAAVAYKHSPFGVECDTGCNAKVPRELLGFLERSYPIDRAVVTAGYEHFAARTEREAGGINYVSQKRLTPVVRCDLVNRHRYFLAARSRKSSVDCAVVGVVSGVRNRMKVFGELLADYEGRAFTR